MVAAHETGLANRIETVPTLVTMTKANRDLMRSNPLGKIPTLVTDDGTVLFDSTVICEYLEDRYPDPPLFPADAATRARCRQLEDEADFAMTDEVTPLVQELFTKTDDASRDLARVAQATEALGRRYATLEKSLAGREYLCGVFTVADIATFMVVGFASTLGCAPGEAQPNVRRWQESMRSRPCVSREFDAMMVAAATV